MKFLPGQIQTVVYSYKTRFKLMSKEWDFAIENFMKHLTEDMNESIFGRNKNLSQNGGKSVLILKCSNNILNNWLKD